MGEIPSTGTIGKEIPFTATTILSKDSSGDYREIGASASLPVSMGDGGGIDAFNRMRISAPASIFDSKQIYDKQPLYWDELLTGSTSTHYPNLACTRLLLPAKANQVASISETINSSLKLVANIAGTSDIILLTARGVSGNSACYGAIKWREIV